MAMSAREARKRLFPLTEQVNDDGEAVEIVSNQGTYLLRSPAKARCLLDSFARVEAGDYETHALISEDEASRQAS